MLFEEANTYAMGILTVAFVYVLYELHKSRRRRGHPGVPYIGPIFDSFQVNVYEEVYDNEVNSVPTGSTNVDNSAKRKKKKKKHKHKHHHHHHHHHRSRSKRSRKSGRSKKKDEDSETSLDEDETQVSEQSDSRIRRKRRVMAESSDKVSRTELIPVARVSTSQSVAK
uniref:Transmembrane protein n=1 Tax=Panagrellus redivivus TaxID=6233 RepID=A0A7E4W0W7_PANRE